MNLSLAVNKLSLKNPKFDLEDVGEIGKYKFVPEELVIYRNYLRSIFTGEEKSDNYSK